MKSLVIYSSRSGNTKKLAQAVHNALSGEKELVPITEVPSLDADYDFIALGFPVMAGKVEPRAKKFLSRFDKNAKLFLFMTHGSLKGSKLVRNVMKQALDCVKDAEVTGVFTCQGEVDARVVNKLKRGSKPLPWLEEATMAKGHPDAADINALVEMIGRLC